MSSTPPRREGNKNRVAKPRQLMTTYEVATHFSVSPKTVRRWADTGKLSHIKTLGGHTRFHADDVKKKTEEGYNG